MCTAEKNIWFVMKQKKITWIVEKQKNNKKIKHESQAHQEVKWSAPKYCCMQQAICITRKRQVCFTWLTFCQQKFLHLICFIKIMLQKKFMGGKMSKGQSVQWPKYLVPFCDSFCPISATAAEMVPITNRGSSGRWERTRTPPFISIIMLIKAWQKG